MKSATPVLIFEILLTLALCFTSPILHAQNPKSAIERLLETQKEYEKAVSLGDSSQLAELCYLLGKRHIGLRNYPKAQQWLLRSLAMREQNAPSEDVGKIYLRMSEIQTEQKNARLSMKYARLAKWNFEQAKVDPGLMAAYRAIAGAFRSTYNENSAASVPALDSAIHYHKKALPIAMRLSKPIDIGITYQGLSDIFFLKKEYQQSENFMLKAFDVYEKNQLYTNHCEASVFSAFYLLKQKKPQAAKKWLTKAKDLAEMHKSVSPGLRVLIEQAHALYYQQTGDWKQAYWHENQVNLLNTEQSDHSRREALHNIGLVFESEKKSAQLAQQRKQLSLQYENIQIQNKLNLITAVLLVMAIVSAVSLFVLFRKYKGLSYQNAVLVQEQNHRTKNSLQSVLDLLGLQMHKVLDPGAKIALEESLLRVEAVALVHRKLYKSENLVDVDLSQYIPDLINSVLRSYRLQATAVVYDVEDIRLHIEKAITLGLIINELTTNACKYALKDNADPKLRVTCTWLSDRLHFSFSDNGPGLVSAGSQNTFGLRLIDILIGKLKATGTFTNQEGCVFDLSFKHHRSMSLVSYTLCL
ncbi:sensor histidine kinase [Dyadobacter sp. CY323]|uniref:sensor histidine kinase n=1 Tax=Dyadobacter sp. CY323 TaxID=2907302 RepID=UPI001F29772F|nr:sensor histidine kinase [Dyadobacter sp. CY323]MCE6992713.1 sensor histidine kinase [Dyadobacter sp. CY323]